MIAHKNKKKNIYKRQKNKQSPSDINFNKNNVIYNGAFLGMLLMLFFPPYFRGLFFANDQLKALICIAVIFWLVFIWECVQNNNKFFKYKLDYLAILLPIIYLLSTVTAINKGLAIIEVLEYMLYFFTYWVVSRLTKSSEDVNKIFIVIYLGAVGVAVLGIASATEIVNISDSFLHGRFSSSLQYSNSLAGYLVPAYIIGTYLWYSSQREVKKHIKWGENIKALLYSCSNFILLAVLLGTKSRGGLLVFLAVVAIYIIGLEPKKRLVIAIHSILIGITALLCIKYFLMYTNNNQFFQAWTYIFIWLSISVCSQYICILLNKNIFSSFGESKFKYNISFILLGIMSIVTGVTTIFIKYDITSFMNLNYLRTAFQRVHFVGDALKMVQERPLLGWGGGGWQEAYRFFQDYMYNSTQVHSYYFQVAVESGILGLTAVLFLFVVFLMIIFKLLKQEDPAIRNIAWIQLAVFLALSGHALIDFDLSLAAISMVLWTMFGVASGLYTKRTLFKQTIKIPPKILLIICTTTALVIIIMSSMVIVSDSYTTKAVNNIKMNKFDKAIESLQKAKRYNPYNSSAYYIISQIYNGLGEYKDAVREAKHGVELRPYDASTHMNLSNIAFGTGQYKMSIQQAEKSVNLAPCQRKWYEELSIKYFSIGRIMLKNNNYKGAREYFEKASKIPHDMDVFMRRLTETQEVLWVVGQRGGPKLTPTPVILFNAGVSQYHLGQLKESENTLLSVLKNANKELKASINLWLALIYDKKGQVKKSNEYLMRVRKFDSYIDKDFERLKQIPILTN